MQKNELINSTSLEDVLLGLQIMLKTQDLTQLDYKIFTLNESCKILGYPKGRFPAVNYFPHRKTIGEYVYYSYVCEYFIAIHRCKLENHEKFEKEYRDLYMSTITLND